MNKVKEYEDSASEEEEKPKKEQASLTVEKKQIKDFNKAFSQLVREKTATEASLVS